MDKRAWYPKLRHSKKPAWLVPSDYYHSVQGEDCAQPKWQRGTISSILGWKALVVVFVFRIFQMTKYYRCTWKYGKIICERATKP